MRSADRIGDPDWHPPMPSPLGTPSTAPDPAVSDLPPTRRRWRPEYRPRPRTGGWLLALGAGAAIALVAVASLSDPRSLGTQLDEAVAGIRGLGDRASEGLTGSRDAAADASRGAVDGISTAINDAAISAKIKAALAADPALSASRIIVTTDNGVVRLEGPAPDANARQRATVLASARDGVRGVDNRLVLPQPGQVVAVVDGQPQVAIQNTAQPAPQPAPANAPATQALPAVPATLPTAPASQAAAINDDAAITSRVKVALGTDPKLVQAGIGVTTERGVVRMEGTVPDLQAKDHALALASTQPGVRSVDNRLALAQPALPVVVSERGPIDQTAR